MIPVITLPDFLIFVSYGTTPKAAVCGLVYLSVNIILFAYMIPRSSSEECSKQSLTRESLYWRLRLRTNYGRNYRDGGIGNQRWTTVLIVYDLLAGTLYALYSPWTPPILGSKHNTCKHYYHTLETRAVRPSCFLVSSIVAHSIPAIVSRVKTALVVHHSFTIPGTQLAPCPRRESA
jgi:hypothetical protein